MVILNQCIIYIQNHKYTCYNIKLALFQMPKKKLQAQGRKRTPNVDLDHQEEEKELQRTNISSFNFNVQIQRKKAMQFLGGNQMPRNFNYRETQIKDITKYIQDCLSKKSKNKYKVLMVSGSPGAGKSLTVNHILTKLQKMPLKVIKFNANLIKTVRDVQQIICREILDRKFGNQMSTLQIIRALQQQKIKHKYVIYIEEVQIIFQQKTNIFTQDFFCLFSNPKLNIMLLGISNTIDAMAKYSKSISVNLNEIKNVVFQPYTLEKIVKIMKQKLDFVEMQYGFKIIITDKVLNFVAAKIQNLKKGDIRIVLQFLRQLANTVLPRKAEQSCPVNQEGYLVSLSTAQGVFNKMRSPKNQIITSLPHTQQIVLIAVYLFIKQKDCLFMTKKDTQRKTKWVCESLGLQFHHKIVEDGIQMLEQYCLISRVKKQNQDRIMLKISLTQIQVSMQDHQLFKKFFITQEK